MASNKAFDTTCFDHYKAQAAKNTIAKLSCQLATNYLFGGTSVHHIQQKDQAASNNNDNDNNINSIH